MEQLAFPKASDPNKKEQESLPRLKPPQPLYNLNSEVVSYHPSHHICLLDVNQ
jgi:hypothetical protein